MQSSHLDEHTLDDVSAIHALVLGSCAWPDLERDCLFDCLGVILAVTGADADVLTNVD